MHSGATLNAAARLTAYRPDIDGIRAVAITSVVAFHVGLPGFGGGFVGVDVFFVISGYLITSLLLGEFRQHGSINLLGFYARRARRLLPAFFLVVTTTLLLAYFLLTEVEGMQSMLGESAIAAALYVSNIYFARVGGGYFDAPSNYYPLLHTWSLAVEEQFYLVWPLILIGAIWASRRFHFSSMRFVLGVLIFVLFASLFYSGWSARIGGRAERVAFFSLLARAWELGIGAFLALALPALARDLGWYGALLSAAGLVAIGTAVVMFHDGLAVPGIAALLPTLGTAAIISGGWLAPSSPTTRLLACRPLVLIGLLSYAWYLWHWPLLAIARAHSLGAKDLSRDGTIVIIALGLAWLTYRLVEDPIRSRRVAVSLRDPSTLCAGAVASLLIIASAYVLTAAANQSGNTNLSELQRARKDQGWSRGRCLHRDDEYEGLIPRKACIGSTNTAQNFLVVWGDSHADHLVGMLETADTARRFRVLPRSMSLCPPLLDVTPFNHGRVLENCAKFNIAVMAEIDELHQEGRLAGVVLGARWSLFLGKPTLYGEAGVDLSSRGKVVRDELAAAALTSGLRSTLSLLDAKGIKSLVVAPVPEQQFRVPTCLARNSVLSCSASGKLAGDQRSSALLALREAGKGLKATYLWDPLPALCSNDICLAKREGVIMYRDDHHLTYSGSRWLAKALAHSVPWTSFAGIEEQAELQRAPAVR